MPQQPNLSATTTPNSNLDSSPAGDALRRFSRSPHPYHRRSSLLTPLSSASGTSTPALQSRLRSSQNTDDEETTEPYVHRLYSLHGGSPRSTDDDSGTEADDEHFLKGLPAPRSRPHKGLRNNDGTLSGTSSPRLSPTILREDGRRLGWVEKRDIIETKSKAQDGLWASEKFRRKRSAELRRRVAEVLLLGFVGGLVLSGSEVRVVVMQWRYELCCMLSIVATFTALYPLRLFIYLASGLPSGRWPSIELPDAFDPAPLLYPPALTIFVSSLLTISNPASLLPNIILSLASLPEELVPSFGTGEGRGVVHWFASCMPLFISEFRSGNLSSRDIRLTELGFIINSLDRETLALLYPLHGTLCVTLHYLTTTSLLEAELQLLSITLINILLLSSSPQTLILNALLWGGGMGIFITCGRVLSWVVALARVPKWRFRRNVSNRRGLQNRSGFMSWVPRLNWLLRSTRDALDDESDDDEASTPRLRKPVNLKLDIHQTNGNISKFDTNGTISAIEQRSGDGIPGTALLSRDSFMFKVQRRHTLPSVSQPPQRDSKMTPSGRKKRSASSSVQSFFSLTETQARFRQWLYASYVYICVLLIILVGIREYVGKYALNGEEPLGWALGYLLGNIPWFRMEVVSANLERWVCLPDRDIPSEATCHLGWVEHLRLSTFGAANTRLLLIGYWFCIILTGLAIVFRLSAIYEVDTRRKVFHFMMVFMLLPATYIDPTYASLALSLVLAVFLLLDLFRASQLPPLSKPLAYFLTPYVDGRDLRGPVVISHIFLLIGCAIPLWLSLGALARTGTGYAAGWEVPTRDVSMVSGVICVGMGDAAASLIGRRYGRHKWFWAGGKSIEGSVAFACAVGSALMLAKAWLVLGGWQTEPGRNDNWVGTARKVGVASTVASLTEAVLTGGNDNVIVPVVLWLCVKGLGI